MIVFDLRCGHGHVFEAWFGSSEDFAQQQKRGLLSCPLCGDATIAKSVMAPQVSRKSNQKTEKTNRKVAAPALDAQAMEMLGKLQKHVEDNFDYVGEKFASEARLIHEGEAEARGIYGEATAEDTQALKDDGIDVFPMPMPAKPRRSDA